MLVRSIRTVRGRTGCNACPNPQPSPLALNIFILTRQMINQLEKNDLTTAFWYAESSRYDELQVSREVPKYNSRARIHQALPSVFSSRRVFHWKIASERLRRIQNLVSLVREMFSLKINKSKFSSIISAARIKNERKNLMSHKK
jgi:hypothetical protein